MKPKNRDFSRRLFLVTVGEFLARYDLVTVARSECREWESRWRVYRFALANNSRINSRNDFVADFINEVVFRKYRLYLDSDYGQPYLVVTIYR